VCNCLLNVHWVLCINWLFQLHGEDGLLPVTLYSFHQIWYVLVLLDFQYLHYIPVFCLFPVPPVVLVLVCFLVLPCTAIHISIVI